MYRARADDLSRLPGDAPGRAAVRDGRVVVTPPRGEGRLPTIRPGSHVEIKVNGEVIQEKTPVGPEDKIELRAVSTEPQADVEVWVTNDRMAAAARVIRQAGVRYELQDIPDGTDIVIMVRPTDDIPPPPVTRERILEALREAGVKAGIDEAAIDKLTDRRRRMSDQEAVVARGRLPGDTVDGYIEPQMKEEHEAYDPDAVKVDLLDRGSVMSVEPGDVIGVWVPPKRGEDGEDVLGNPIPARDPEPRVLTLGEGVSQREETGEIVADRAGRPVIEGTAVSVVLLYEHPGDVTVETGHVDFGGDVHIKGSVEESLQVRAGGSVVVDGMVAKAARITAGGHVTVKKSVVGATIEAGGDATVYARLEEIFATLDAQFRKALQGALQIVEELEEAGKTVPFGQLAKIVFERRFPEVPETVEEMAAYLGENGDRVDQGLVDVADEIAQALTGRGPLLMQGPADFQHVGSLIRSVCDRLKESAGAAADVTADYLQNAKISCSGKVVITGKACFNSEISAGRGLEAGAAVVRGGRIFSTRGTIKAKELGSGSAVVTEVETGPEGKVEAEIAHIHVKCTIGRRTHRFQKTTRGVNMYFDEETDSLRITG